MQRPAWLHHKTPIVCFVFAVALAIRIAYLIAAARLQINTSFYTDDSRVYETLARSLLAGQGLSLNGQPSAFVGPAYPLFVAGVLGVFHTLAAIEWLQAVMGAATAALITLIGWRFAGPGAGIGAGLIAAAYPHLVFWTGHVLTETSFATLVALTVWLLVEGQARSSRWWFAAAGLSLALGTLTRPQLLAFLPVAAVCAWWLGQGRDRAIRAGLVLVAALALIVPWTVRNAVEMGIVTPVSTESPYVLWQGNSPGATGGTRGYVGGGDFQQLPLPADVSEVDWYRAYDKAVTNYLLAHPFSVLQRMPVKVWNQWRPVYAGSSLRNWATAGLAYLAMMALAAVGLWATRRGVPPEVRYGQALVLTFVAVHAVVTGMIRFRLPIEAMLIVFAGVGLQVAWRWVTAGRPRRIALTQTATLAPTI